MTRGRVSLSRPNAPATFSRIFAASLFAAFFATATGTASSSSLMTSSSSGALALASRAFFAMPVFFATFAAGAGAELAARFGIGRDDGFADRRRRRRRERASVDAGATGERGRGRSNRANPRASRGRRSERSDGESACVSARVTASGGGVESARGAPPGERPRAGCVP